ncbi:MAG: reprolysin-like metallopeptidase [Candidatus Binatia bacterium]
MTVPGRIFLSFLLLLGAAFPAASVAAARRPALSATAGRSDLPVLRRGSFSVDLDAVARGRAVRLELFEHVELEARDIRVEARRGGLLSWSARVGESPQDVALLVLRGDRIAGLVATGGSTYRIETTASGELEVLEVAAASLPAEAEPVSFAVAESIEGAREARAVQRDAVDAIRILVAYTPAAAAASADIEAEAQLAVDAANTAYQNSGMATRLDLIATTETDYVESGDISVDLFRLRSTGDGHMDELHSLRNAWLADFVSLLSANGGGYCGIGALMTTVSQAFAPSALNVVWLPCAATNWTMAHELGHNMGCHHERANATSTPATEWAYGYQQPAGSFRTVMATTEECPGACPRVAHFSNPDVDFLGEPTGIASSQVDAADCSLAIDGSSPVTTDFRTLLAPSSLSASGNFTDRVAVGFAHPWPWGFQVYRAETGQPMQPLAVASGSPFADTTAVPGVGYDYGVSTLTALGEESAVVGPVAGVRSIPDCGNGAIEPPVEECDDGGVEPGDGCSADCLSEIPLGGDEARCVLAINDGAVRLAKAQGKENLRCLAAAAAGTEGDMNACVEADSRGKVAQAREKLFSSDSALCQAPPSFGYGGVTAAAEESEGQRRDAFLDLFGSDLDAATVSKAEDSSMASCQKAMAKAADKLVAAELAAFLKCKKGAIGAGTVVATENLEACLDEVSVQAAAAKGRVAAALAKVAGARAKACAALNLATAFPGACAGEAGTAFDECVGAHAACRMCRTFAAADALSRDCDLFDNGLSDGSCVP